MSFNGATVEDFCIVVYLTFFLSSHRCAAIMCFKTSEIRFLYYNVLHCLCVVWCLFLYSYLFVFFFKKQNKILPPDKVLVFENELCKPFSVLMLACSNIQCLTSFVQCCYLIETVSVFFWYRKCSVEVLPHKSVFRSASAEL